MTTTPIPFEAYGPHGRAPLIHFAHANAYPPGSYGRFLRQFTPDYRVLAMHQRPLWPHSNPADLTSWAVFADDLLRFLDEQQLDQVIGMGHSLGAVATLFAALKQPERFSELVLIEPVFLPPRVLALEINTPGAFQASPMAKVARRRRARWPDPTAAFDHFRRKQVFARWSDDVLRDYLAAGLRPDGDDVVLAYGREWEATIYAHPPLTVWDDVARVTHPTLAIRGAESDTIFPEAWELWQAKQPAATFVQLPDAGHLVPMEQPEPLATTIVTTLKNDAAKRNL